ncbi:MAG: MgtC/SapB family protein [Eubacterium sp.]|nr:MgtC/SapB family protein [Eubacterium sp.]
MLEILDYLREFHMLSIFLRLILAMLAGGVIGYGRSRKRKTAGLRTFMLISIGAALTLLLASYEYHMLTTQWSDAVAAESLRFDGSRYAAQVLSGIGFIAAGTIITDTKQQVEGLTTATGLFACACMGLAAGAGFYECVIIVLVIIILVLDVLFPLEPAFKRRLRHLTMFVEFNKLEDIEKIVAVIKSQNAEIHELDFARKKRKDEKYPSAIIEMTLSKENISHSNMLTSVAELPCVQSIQELIS